MGRGLNVQWRRTAREAAGLVLLALAAGCRDGAPSLRVVWRAPLPAASRPEAVAALPDQRVWLGGSGRALVVDTLGRVTRQVTLPGPTARVIGIRGDRLVVTQGARGVALVPLDSGEVTARRTLARAEPTAADPRGVWIYTTHAWGSVTGLDSLLVTRWGWPDVGARGTALAVGPLADRIYLAVAEGRETEAAVHVLDAWTGRVLSSWPSTTTLDGLAAGPVAAQLFAWDRQGVLALRHGAGGLVPVWRAPVGRLRMDHVVALRPSPDGARLAVLGRRDGAGRLVVLSTASGRDTARWNGSPPDAAWDVRGRLVVPEGRELLWLQ